MNANEFSHRENTYRMYHLKGKVVGKDKVIETVVSGGEGGRNYTAPVKSTTIVHDKIFIQDEQGKEHAIELQNWDIACREGNNLLILWIIKDQHPTGPYVAIRNFTTNSIKISDSAIATLAGKSPGNSGCAMILIIAGAIFLGVVLLIYYEEIYGVHNIERGLLFCFIVTVLTIFFGIRMISKRNNASNSKAHLIRKKASDFINSQT